MSPRRAASLAAVSVLLLGGAALGGPAFSPEEAGRLLDPMSPWSRAFPLAARIGTTPETAARLPGLLAAAAAAALIALSAGRTGAASAGGLLGGLSPVLIAAGRTAGPEPFAALLGAAAVLAWSSRRRFGQAAALGLLVLGAGLLVPGLLLGARDRPLAAALGAWGLLFGPGLPPWRIDIAIPALACALPLLWLGAGTSPRERLLGSGGPLIAAAVLGAFATRATLAPLMAVPLTPWCLFAIARGAGRRGRRVPASLLVAVAITAGGIGIADLHVERDVLDPARRVAWDEAARMLAVLAQGDTRIEAAPDLPASLVLYAPGRKLEATGGPTPRRVLVVSHGHRGGLDRPGADIEHGLARSGYTLRGELLLGEMEPGFVRLFERHTGAPAASEYLRVRRYEREE